MYWGRWGSHGGGEGWGWGGGEAEDQVVELGLGVLQVPSRDSRIGMLDHLHGPDYVGPEVS